MNASYLLFGDSYIEAPGKINIEINFRNKTGKLLIPEKSIGQFEIRNLSFKDIDRAQNLRKDSVHLGSGSHIFVLPVSRANLKSAPLLDY